MSTTHLALGRHLTIEYHHCDHDVLAQPDTIQTAMLDAANASHATVLDWHFHRFEPQGVSGFLIIAESHFSIHTWPEFTYAAVDIFTCNHTIDFDAAIASLQRGLAAQAAIVSADLGRGLIMPPQHTPDSPPVFSWETLFKQRQASGLSVAIDIYGCPPTTPARLPKVTARLAELLNLHPMAAAQVVETHDGLRVAHILNRGLIAGLFQPQSAHLDISVTGYFDPEQFARDALDLLKGRSYRLQVNLR